MFAIASDDVTQVRQVLENGDAGPNDPVGPQSALAFALTNDQLTHKMEIVKTLLAYGADPTVLKQHSKTTPRSASDVKAAQLPPALMEEMDPATRYYVERADAPHTRRTSALIHRSFFRPLTRVRYELVGQDRALEQLFRVLSIHSRNLSVTPIVVLLCGPSGHGKSLLARKFGSLLDVPTHTVNMTTLKATDDLWKSYSMSPYETPTTCTLAEFLINNEGKRCVVVLDEIEKTHDEKTLWSLLMPWELGRCAFDANGRHVDVRNVIWLGTSNVGHDLVFEHHEARASPDELMTREEYMELMGLLRPRVSDRLGASILSRVTTVLPFVPFTLEERRAICAEALHTIAGDIVCTLPTNVVDSMVNGALADYSATEGARSLYRAVSNQLVDNI
ncbi:P-loop containing nucleoside triphosphate hydrolase protein [Collybia nuda]|uniref:P-loop containing nucleoside triphosphate hydrolase protein n=1 Tax=Collybia nuda TaxID=64659 RepID=A0A9P5YHI2_9AGAR|nr:P-loop containing nucleoside triphosphate hydrolase protein [Collybia nuda]